MNSGKLLPLLVLVVVGSAWYLGRSGSTTPLPEQRGAAALHNPAGAETPDSAAGTLRLAVERRARGVVLLVSGTVERTLPDDQDGSPHQRFIIRTDDGFSLLVAHNLELAPRLEGLRSGDRVTLRGEYAWNERGGVMHWTHDDPQGRHPAGYIDWNARRYQ